MSISRNRSIFLLCCLQFLATFSGAAPSQEFPQPPPRPQDEADTVGPFFSFALATGPREDVMRLNGCFTPPVVTMLDALRSEDFFCRSMAIRELGERGEKDAIPELERIQATDPIESNRNQAAIELIRLGERSYVANARRAMEQIPDLREQVSFASDLAEVGDASGFPYLEQVCRSSALEDRKACSWGLRRFEGVAALDERLREALSGLALLKAEDTDPEVRKAALRVLDVFANRKSLPPSVLDGLETLAVSSPDPEIRDIASRAVESQKEPPNRLFEIYRLGRRGGKSDIPGLKTIFESDSDPRARLLAALSLVRLGERSYLAALRKAMEENPDDRLELAGDLAQVGDASGYQYVEEACRSGDPKKRQSGLVALLNFYDLAMQDERLMAALLNHLLDLADDTAPPVRKIATYTLETCSRSMALPEPAVARLERLAASAAHPEVQEMARTAVEEQKRQKQEVKEPKP